MNPKILPIMTKERMLICPYCPKPKPMSLWVEQAQTDAIGMSCTQCRRIWRYDRHVESNKENPDSPACWRMMSKVMKNEVVNYLNHFFKQEPVTEDGIGIAVWKSLTHGERIALVAWLITVEEIK